MSDAAKTILTAYLVLAAAWDLRTRRVPNWLTLPLLAGVLTWRLAQLDFTFVPYWCACLVAWLVNSLRQAQGRPWGRRGSCAGCSGCGSKGSS